MSGINPKDIRSQFERDGYVGLPQFLTKHDCRSLMRYVNGESPHAAIDWEKGGAVADWLLYRIASSPRLVEQLEALLGNDIILWGCSTVRRRAGQAHPWHVDIETSMPNGRFVSVWVGLENTRRNAGFQLIAGSHLSPKTIQEIQAERGIRRGEASTDTVLNWAREHNANASLVTPDVDDGDAILFDGRVWHGSRNDRSTGTRTALLLQYASADSAVRMHDDSKLEWPFSFLTEPRPPSIVIRGTADDEVNRLVSPPKPDNRKGTPMLSSLIRPLGLPLEEKSGEGWTPYQQFGGTTPVLSHMNCHASVLSAGHCPHPPHGHKEEELLIILEGEAELVTADTSSWDGAKIEKAGKGAFAYYPAFQRHTIRNSSDKPVSYVMFKWHAEGARPGPEPIGTSVFRYPDGQGKEVSGWQVETVMEGATDWLSQLHCHESWLEPGAGYEPHADAYDVAIVLLEGQVETLGQPVEEHSVIYYAAGEKHGIRNMGDKPARYLVFEFHPSSIDLSQLLGRRFAPVAKQVLKRSALAFGVDLGRIRARLTADA